MFGAALILFRESLEAALLVGILSAAVRHMPGKQRWIGVGIGLGIAGSLALGLAGKEIAEFMDGVGTDLLQSIILAIALSMLAWHCIVSARHGAEMARRAGSLGQQAEQSNQANLAIALATGLTILREGMECVIFLLGYASSGQSQTAAAMVAGGILGLCGGVGVGVVVYFGLSRISLRNVFAATNLLILFFAAGLAAQLARTMEQAGWLSAWSETIWDSSSVLPADSVLGVFLRALIGYDARPSGMQIAFYLGCLLLIGASMQLARLRNAPRSIQRLKT